MLIKFSVCSLFIVSFIFVSGILQPVLAQPMLFDRAVITIEGMRNTAPQTTDEATLPWQSEDKQTKPQPAPLEKVSQQWKVDVRAAEHMRLQWLHQNMQFNPRQGVLLVLDTPTNMPDLSWLLSDIEYDFIFIGANGVVLSIMPAELPQSVMNVEIHEKPAKAILLTTANAAEAYDVAPQDKVNYTLFVADPVVLR